MTYQSYKQTRDSLCNKIQSLIDQGNLGKEYRKLCFDVAVLDGSYDSQKYERRSTALTFKEYKNKRDQLMNELQKLIDTNAADSVYNAKVAEINSLDGEWEKICQRNANVNAMNDKQRSINVQDLPGVAADGSEVVSFAVMGGKGGTFPGSRMASDPLYLGSGRTMVDLARKNHPEQMQLLNTEDALGEVVRGIVTGRWSNPELKNVVTTSGSSVIIPEVLSARVIDLARDISLFGAAVVPTVPMESNNLKISRIASDPVFKFKEEGAAADESSFTLDSVTLNSHTIYGYAYCTLEAIESSKTLDSIIRQVFAEAIAQGIDQGFLYGQYNSTSEAYDSFAPSGIMNDQAILVHEALTTGTKYNDFLSAIGKIRKQNGVPTVAAMNSDVDLFLSCQTDLNGNYITPPQKYAELKKIVTNQLKNCDSLVFDPSAMLIGIQNNVRIRVLDQGDEQLKKGLIAFQIYAMLDCKVVRPKAICKITETKEPETETESESSGS